MSLDRSDTAALRQTPAVRYVEELIEIQMLASHSHSMINHFTDSWDMGRSVLQHYLPLLIKIAAFPLCNSSEMITRIFLTQTTYTVSVWVLYYFVKMTLSFTMPETYDLFPLRVKKEVILTIFFTYQNRIFLLQLTFVILTSRNATSYLAFATFFP